MYLTMNRFKVKHGAEDAFEAIWTGRDSRLPQTKGFLAFHLLKGPRCEDHVLYASHTAWESEAAFQEWTRSDAFRASHRGAGAHADMYLGPPDLEIFETLQTITGPSGHAP